MPTTRRPARSRRAIPTVTEARRLVGRGALFHDHERPGHRGVWFSVKVVEARFTWGRLQLLVEPRGGKGRFWTERDRLKFPAR